MRSLRSRLLLLWVLSLAASLAVGVVLVQLYRQSSQAQTGRSAAALDQACDAIAENYAYYTAGWAGPAPGAGRPDGGFGRDLSAVVGLAMTGRVGLEAGIWQSLGGGEGQALAQEPPAAARAAIAAAAAGAAQEDEPIGFSTPADGGERLGLACPLGGPLPGLAAWVLSRDSQTPGTAQLRIGLGVLMALVLLSTLWLSALLLAWSRRIRAIEAALAGQGERALPHLPPTGERELDRIVAALNAAGERLAEAQARSEALSARVAAAERLAALGRVAAGVAHEIRNPIAAMRLRAENALAGDPARGRAALEAILGQVARLDRLIGELLAMTQRRDPAFAPVEVPALLAACAAEHQEAAGPVRLVVVAPTLRGLLDGGLLRRILDNLVQNAIRHTPPGGTVTLGAALADGMLRLSVADTGPGVPDALRDSLFEPFVTGRPDGTGLGLAIARELAEAHGGRLTLAEGAGGATFVLEVPWHAC